MDATSYIGRVGALAVALGVGVAISSGTGVAWADGGHTSAGSSHDSSSRTAGAAGGGKRTATAPAAPDTARTAHSNRHRAAAAADDRGKAVKRRQGKPDAQPSRLAALPDRGRTQASEPEAPHRNADQRTHARIAPQTTATANDATAGAASITVTPATKVSAAAASSAETLSTASPTETAVAEAPKATGTTLMSLITSAALAPFAGHGPHTPAQSPVLLAMLAWARREFEQVVNQSGSTPAANQLTSLADGPVSAATVPQAATLAAAVTAWQQNPGATAAPVISGGTTTTQAGWTTGPNTNTAHWYIAGTDLGIMWNSGYTDPQTGKPVIFTLFGDTYSDPNMSGDWRNNVLLRSSDLDLSNGLQFSDALIHAGANATNPGVPQWYSTAGARAGAAQIIVDPGGLTGLFGTTYTMIPTSAIAVQNADGSVTQYATVMSVRTWDNPGSWTTNYSAIASSTDGGLTWNVDPGTVRSSGWLRTSTGYVSGDEHFQQSALVYGNPDDPNSYTGPADDPNREAYVYVYGTPSGRQGSAYLARVPESQITNLGAYQYWAGEASDGTGNWVTGKPSAAIPVIGASSTDFLPQLYKFFDCFTFGLFSKILNGIWVGGLPTGGNVSEMSVQYNDYLQRYVVTYTDGANNVVMRVSDTPQGTWSSPTKLISNSLVGQNTGMYAPMIHPLSGTSALGAGNEHYLYFNLSQWGDYNVRMMQADLGNLTIT